jgi:hypothetical protein
MALLVRTISDTTKMLQSDLSSKGIAVSDAAALECATQIVLHRQHQHHHEGDVGRRNGDASSST